MSMSPKRSNRRVSQSNRRGSASFLMFKDLETKEEFQKVKMAGFLRELHKLAVEETKAKVRSGIERTTSKNKSAAAAPGGDAGDGTMTLAGMDLEELTPAQANEKIAALHAGEKFDSASLMSLAQAAIAVMGEEDTVVDIREKNPDLKKVIVVGDIHGSLNCLMSVLEICKTESLTREDTDRVVIFDGDFVDRGNNSLEVLSTLLLLKLSRPSNIILLRGNHEDSMTASTYGFREEIEDKYGYEVADEIWYEFGHLFAAFPIIARSSRACVMHGGIPSEDFSLDDANELDKEIRCQLKTIADPYDDDERLVQGILWSDPSDIPGLNESDRGAGFTFGPDISKDFLDREGLDYLIRAHEPFEAGTNLHDVGGGKGVVTIFSTANYPDGEGTNNGAVLFLDEITGEYETPSFIHQERDAPASGSYESWLTSIVDGNKSQLVKAFRKAEDKDGLVTVFDWADIVADTLDLPDIAWFEIQADLAPTTTPEGELLDWNAFVTRFSAQDRPKTDNLSKEQLNVLHEHKDKFLDIFQLLDTDGSGTISEEEFVSGIAMLNNQMPGESLKIENPAA